MLNKWAQDHNITPAAMRALRLLLQAGYTNGDNVEGMSETAVDQRVCLEASRRGARLFRNNKGACINEYGNFMRFGLCNTTKKQGAELRSSDRVGIVPYVVRPYDVGRVLGIFWAVEMKKQGWKFNPHDEHEEGQQKFLNLILSLGGFAQFAQGPEDLLI